MDATRAFPTRVREGEGIGTTAVVGSLPGDVVDSVGAGGAWTSGQEDQSLESAASSAFSWAGSNPVNEVTNLPWASKRYRLGTPA